MEHTKIWTGLGASILECVSHKTNKHPASEQVASKGQRKPIRTQNIRQHDGISFSGTYRQNGTFHVENSIDNLAN